MNYFGSLMLIIFISASSIVNAQTKVTAFDFETALNVKNGGLIIRRSTFLNAGLKIVIRFPAPANALDYNGICYRKTDLLYG